MARPTLSKAPVPLSILAANQGRAPCSLPYRRLGPTLRPSAANAAPGPKDNPHRSCEEPILSPPRSNRDKSADQSPPNWLGLAGHTLPFPLLQRTPSCPTPSPAELIRKTNRHGPGHRQPAPILPLANMALPCHWRNPLLNGITRENHRNPGPARNRALRTALQRPRPCNRAGTFARQAGSIPFAVADRKVFN